MAWSQVFLLCPLLRFLSFLVEQQNQQAWQRTYSFSGVGVICCMPTKHLVSFSVHAVAQNVQCHSFELTVFLFIFWGEGVHLVFAWGKPIHMRLWRICCLGLIRTISKVQYHTLWLMSSSLQATQSFNHTKLNNWRSHVWLLLSIIQIILQGKPADLACI